MVRSQADGAGVEGGSVDHEIQRAADPQPKKDCPKARDRKMQDRKIQAATVSVVCM